MKICLIGGAGYIGTFLSNNLEHEITVIDDFRFGDFINSDIIKIRKNFNDIKTLDYYDVVIYLAGISSVMVNELTPENSYYENVVLPLKACLLSKNSGIKKFIYSSSCSVYDSSEGDIKKEKDTILKSKFHYSNNKRNAEEVLLDLNDKNFEVIIVRNGTVCGHSDNFRTDLLINKMCFDALMYKKITIKNNNLNRPILFIEDLKNFYNILINSKKNNKGIINAMSFNTSLIEASNRFKEKFGTEISVNDDNSDNRDYLVDNTKMLGLYNPIGNLDLVISNILENFNYNIYSNRLDYFNKTGVY